ncbi:MAG: hypothetical protein ACFFAN_16035 [Promethearchaeota archaeon]
MNNGDNFVLFDSIKKIKINGEFNGSIISKCIDSSDSIIFSDNIKISNEISISEGLMVGFEQESNRKVAFSKKLDFLWNDLNFSTLEYIVLVPSNKMQKYDEGQFTDTFPFTINMLHTAGLYLNDNQFPIDYLDFFTGEILKNPVCLIYNGICIADRIAIDHHSDPFFYDCLIVGRDKSENLSVTYEPYLNIKMDENIIKYIIILGIEELKF